MIGPWTLRNYAHHGRFVLVASEGGVTFWTGNHPRARGEGDLAANLDLKQEQSAARPLPDAVRRADGADLLSRGARLDPIASDRLAALELRKVFYLVVPIGPSYTLHSTRYYLASVISYADHPAAGDLRRRPAATRPRPHAGLWLLVASAVAVCLVFFPQERFRIPVIDPALAVLAGTLFRDRAEDGA